MPYLEIDSTAKFVKVLCFYKNSYISIPAIALLLLFHRQHLLETFLKNCAGS